MPPVRIKERAKAKKGTIKRLLKTLFKLYPIRLSFALFCIVFNVFANLSSSIFANFVTVCISQSVFPTTPGMAPQNPFIGSYDVTAMGITLVGTNVTYLLIAMASIYAFGIFAAWWWNRTMAIVTQLYMNRFRKEMFNHLQDLPIKYFDTHKHGEIMSLFTNDIDTIRQFISQALPMTLQAGLAVGFCLIAMLLNSIWLTLVTLVCSIAMFYSIKVIGGRAAKFFIKQQKQVGEVEGNIQESINGLKVIKVFTHEEESIEQFDEANNLLKDYSTTANIHGNVTGPINMNIGNFMYILTAVVAFLMLVIPGFDNLSLTGWMPITIDSLSTFWGIVISFLMMSRMFANNVNNFSQQVTFIVMGMAGASRCLDLMDEKPEVDEGYVYLCNIIRHEDGTFEDRKSVV